MLNLTIHIHQLDQNRYEQFIAEKRKDPYTKQEFKVGDRIVFCAKCQSALLVDSWQTLQGKHCGQEETLADFISLENTVKMRFKDPKLEAEIKNLKSKIKIFITMLIILFLGLTSSIGIGYYYVKTYQEKLTYKEGEGEKLSNNNSELNNQLTDIEKKITSLENIEEIKNLSCYKKKSSAKKEKISLLEQKLNVLATKINCLISQNNSNRKDRDLYNNALEGYPYSLPSGSSVEYAGYLSYTNNESNAKYYRLYVPASGRFNIYLFKTTTDVDFEIKRRIDGSIVSDSRRANSGTSGEKLDNFYLDSGIYDIKVWNDDTNNGTDYSLKIYRY